MIHFNGSSLHISLLIIVNLRFTKYLELWLFILEVDSFLVAASFEDVGVRRSVEWRGGGGRGEGEGEEEEGLVTPGEVEEEEVMKGVVVVEEEEEGKLLAHKVQVGELVLSHLDQRF